MSVDYDGNRKQRRKMWKFFHFKNRQFDEKKNPIILGKFVNGTYHLSTLFGIVSYGIKRYWDG